MADPAMGAKVPTSNPHDVPLDSPAADFPMPLPPLIAVESAQRPSAAEEARTLVANATVGTLASLTASGDPWASVVTYGQLEDGTPVLCVSRLALHGRNLAADARASLAISATVEPGEDPSDVGRVTLAGEVEQPQGSELDAARAAYRAAVPSGEVFAEFGDFTFWLLRVRQIRWVGGFGRMANADPADYAAAAPDPVAPRAAYAVRHLNEDHSDALLEMACALAGHTDALAASCLRADRYGLDLDVKTPRGRALARVGFAKPVVAPDGLRAATVELARRARGA
jgi:putative heme iron utilization protein